MPIIKAYKLVRLRRDGTFGPLFIDRKRVLPIGEWLEAESVPTKGYQLRPGWHAVATPEAPHLSTKGRVWVEVRLQDFDEYQRPDSQGGKWFVAERMKIVRVLL